MQEGNTKVSIRTVDTDVVVSGTAEYYKELVRKSVLCPLNIQSCPPPPPPNLKVAPRSPSISSDSTTQKCGLFLEHVESLR